MSTENREMGTTHMRGMNRPLILAYGIASYLVFFATFVTSQ